MRYWKPKKIGAIKVGVAVAAHVADDRQAASLCCLVASFQAQTHPHWQLRVVHDGPYSHDPATLRFFDQWDREPRVVVAETKERKQQFGHPHRQAAIEQLLKDGCEWIGLTNQDNYYVPVYLEWMLYVAGQRKVPFVYCDCVHSHQSWKPMATRPKRGHIDLGGFLAHRSVVEKVKFDKVTFAADGDYVERLVAAGRSRSEKVPATLFVHN